MTMIVVRLDINAMAVIVAMRVIVLMNVVAVLMDMPMIVRVDQ